MAMRPKGYRRFESMDDASVPNEIAGGHPLRVQGPIRLSRDAGGNRCVVFPSGAPGRALPEEEIRRHFEMGRPSEGRP
jgi:hypothetical protein